MKRVTDRIDRVVRDGEGLDINIANHEIRASAEEPPIAVLP
jgi:hypothetical protein